MENSVEGELHQRTSGPRYVELDALRGLAAFAVIWHHFHAAFDDGALHWYLRPILSGRPAVILFFVLSGYVLSLPVWRDRQPTYGIYLVRRFFRIYVPYAAAVLVAVVGAHFFSNAQKPLSPWFYRTWHSPITRAVIVRNLLTTRSPALNTAFWSLRYEVQMSFVMPFVAKCMRWLGRPRSAALILVFGTLIESYLAFHRDDANYLLGLLHFGLCFAVGALMAQNATLLQAWFHNQGLVTKSILLTATILLFYSDPEALNMLGAGGLILFALYSGASRWLKTPVPEYLGWVSYSMYLVHGSVLFVLLILLSDRLHIWSLGALYLVCVLLASHIFCSLIEQPSLRLGRKLTST